MIFCFFLFFFCCFMLVFYNVHFMVLLLILEAVLLSIFLFFLFYFLFSFGLLGLFTFLLVIVCMGGFSISILVSLARLSGRDFWYFRFVF